MNQILNILIDYVSTAAQILAVIVIAVGLLRASYLYLKEAVIARNSRKAIALGRLELGMSFSLGLGFLIGSSILKSAIAPSWDDIGKLLAVIGIRTIMNYFLQLDVSKTNKELLEQDRMLDTPFFRRMFGFINRKKTIDSTAVAGKQEER
ncbi:MAG TPA: DUF1622 domain-containing protein [Spirochaetia bacterium]|nr:DUF1622 domain-containing protein [Spirochaetia bacterium]